MASTDNASTLSEDRLAEAADFAELGRAMQGIGGTTRSPSSASSGGYAPAATTTRRTESPRACRCPAGRFSRLARRALSAPRAEGQQGRASYK
jgi:hypothetical protein